MTDIEKIVAVKPTRIAYERRYGDNSGVQIRVAYDADSDLQISVTDMFYAEHLDFVIASLASIRAHIMENADAL